MPAYQSVASAEQVEEYLQLRQKLKDEIKKKNKKYQEGSVSASTNSEGRKRKLPNDNYGSFFGPSETVISRRVIAERKSIFAPTPSKSRRNVETRKKNRDCSFLFSSNNDAADVRPLSSKPAQPVLTSNKVRRLILSANDDDFPEPSKVLAPQTAAADGCRTTVNGEKNSNSTQVSSPSSVTKISASEDEAAVRIIRKLFGYDPTKYADRDGDVSNMEAIFEDVIREDKRRFEGAI